ncbi:MAG: FAD-dependent oxidoreductase [Pseudomonadales bacterium]
MTATGSAEEQTQPGGSVSSSYTGGPLALLQDSQRINAGQQQLDVAIVGAGICGMCTAITLAERGHRITLYERDSAPPEGDADAAFFGWQRSGAGQFRHPHAFLGLVCNLLADRYPQLLDELFAAGARKVGFTEMLPYALRAGYRSESGDEALWVLLCRRATMETVIRRHVATLPGVRIVNGVKVTGLRAAGAAGTESGAAIEVNGLNFSGPDGEVAIDADIVVDASGRTSRFPKYLAQLGCVVPEEKEDAEILYYTRHYQLQDGEVEPPRGEIAGAGDLGYLKFGVFPGDNGHFAIILCIPVDEAALKVALRDGDQFDAICRSIPGLAPWLAPGKSSPTTDSFGIADIYAVWRDYAPNEQPLALNFFAVGDSHLRTNPLYGRGCSTGVLHAAILADVLSDKGNAEDWALAFEQLTRDGLRPIYEASLAEDRKGKHRALAVRTGRNIERAKSLKKYLGLAFGDALSAAATREVHVVRGLMRTVNLLETPGAFLSDPKIKRTLMRYMLRGRKSNAASRFQPGPDRQTMHEQVLGLPVVS